MPQAINGFLGTRATFMLDVVALAMLVVLPLLVWSIYLVKYRQQYALHKRLQVALGSLLLVTVILFEIDIRLHGWSERAAASPFNGQNGGFNWVRAALYVHLGFAVSAAVLWVAVIVQALRLFSVPAAPGAHSAWHRRFGKLAAYDMLLTAVTGWIFYWLAFVA